MDFRGLCASVLLVGAGCAAVSEIDDLEIHGEKTLSYGKDTTLYQVSTFLSDWDNVKAAIETYDSRDCLKRKLTMDFVSSVDIIASEEEAKNVPIAGGIAPKNLDGLDQMIILGTKEFCNTNKDDESLPTWILVKMGQTYRVIKVILLYSF